MAPRRRGRLLERLLLSGFTARLIAAYVGLVLRTTRWTIEGGEGAASLAAQPGGIVAVMWHGRLFLSPTYAPAGRRAVAMISQSRDGDLVAGIAAAWGVGAVRGSTYDSRKRREKGGRDAYAAAAAELRRGSIIAITPDGPRGPARRAQPGAAQLAIAERAPVVAVAFSARWAVNLPSWDAFLLPLPFGRGAIVYSEPRLPPEASGQQALGAFLHQIEADLDRVTDRADALCGRAAAAPKRSAA